jgi:hypothetical protein
MRYRIYAIVHLVILVFYLGRPVMPYIQYAIFKDYIAKNLCVNKDKPKSCCQGKCYLEKQVKKANEATDTENKNNSKKTPTREVNEFLSSYLTSPEVFEVYISHVYGIESCHTVSAISPIFIPPENTSIV